MAAAAQKRKEAQANEYHQRQREAAANRGNARDEPQQPELATKQWTNIGGGGGGGGFGTAALGGGNGGNGAARNFAPPPGVGGPPRRAPEEEGGHAGAVLAARDARRAAERAEKEEALRQAQRKIWEDNQAAARANRAKVRDVADPAPPPSDWRDAGSDVTGHGDVTGRGGGRDEAPPPVAAPVAAEITPAQRRKEWEEMRAAAERNRRRALEEPLNDQLGGGAAGGEGDGEGGGGDGGGGGGGGPSIWAGGAKDATPHSPRNGGEAAAPAPVAPPESLEIGAAARRAEYDAAKAAAERNRQRVLSQVRLLPGLSSSRPELPTTRRQVPRPPADGSTERQRAPRASHHSKAHREVPLRS
jgi:hypothetical protein